MPEQVPRPIGGDPGQLGGREVDHLVHLRLVLAQRAADRDPVTGAGRDRLHRDRAQIGLDAALDDPVDRLSSRAVLGVPAQAALQPAVRALHRARRVVAGDVKRRALVEHERDVRAERGLDRHRGLRAQEPLTPVQVGAKAHAALLDREDRPRRPTGRGPAAALDLVGDAAVAHREDLKAPGVGDDRPLPAHEPVQAAELGHQLRSRGQEQVEGVAEHHLVAERLDVARLERLDGAPRGQRHERRASPPRRARGAACPGERGCRDRGPRS